MHGVPSDLPIDELVGEAVTLISLGTHQFQLHFGEGANLSVEGKWHLTDRGGAVLDRSVDPPSSRDTYRLHRLLFGRVAATSINAPQSFSLVFENGDTLTVFDDTPAYESFSLTVRGRSTYV